MARAVRVRLEGVERVQQKFRTMAEVMKLQTMDASVAPAANIVLDEMKRLVPLDEGTLKASLGMRVVERTSTRAVMALEKPLRSWT